jgi:small subunit ribosomal protein S19
MHRITSNMKTKEAWATEGGLKVWSRRSFVLPYFVGHRVKVHTGKSFLSLLVTENMIGHKFGEFAITRQKVFHKKKKKK